MSRVAGQVGAKRTRRQAAKEYRRAAAAARARARRRSQIMLAVLAALAVAGIVVAVTLLVRGSADETPNTLDPPATPSAAAFPPLPPGTDPALATKPVVQAGAGEVAALKVTTLVEGSGAAARNGSQLQVNYVGVTYRDGREFGSSWEEQSLLPLTLGTGGVIPGWDQGLLGVKQGSRVQLDVPSELAYTDQPTGGRPGGDLRFVVDVLSVT